MQNQNDLRMYIALFPIDKNTQLRFPLPRSSVNGPRAPDKGRQMSHGHPLTEGSHMASRKKISQCSTENRRPGL